MSRQSPLREDTEIAEIGARHGFVTTRRTLVRITDKKALKARGLVKEGLDYARIRALLESGAEVAGAELSQDVEYFLYRPAETTTEE